MFIPWWCTTFVKMIKIQKSNFFSDGRVTTGKVTKFHAEE